jgi:P-type Cu2+ transporter
MTRKSTLAKPLPSASLSPLLAPVAGPIALAEPASAVVDDPLELARFTRWLVGPQGQRLGESALQLSGLHCAACAGIIESVLHRVPGVHSVQISAASERATVGWDPAQTQVSALLAAVRRAGYEAVPDAAAPARALRRADHRLALWRLFVAGFCAMQVMMLATPSYVAAPGTLSSEMRLLLNWGSWLLSVPVLVFSAAPFFRGAWRALRARRIGMDVPVALGIAITFVASTGATFHPQGVFGPEVYFDSLTMFIGFLLGARYVELLARHRAADALEAQLAGLPQTAWRLGGNGQQEEVSVQRLRVGDLLSVPVGQAFAADGVIESGHTAADESLLTGESVPVPKREGDLAVAGSLNLLAPVRLRVQRTGADTRFEALVSMMRSAMSQRPSAARVADRWAAPFLWAVLLLATAGAAVWSLVDPSRAVWVAVSVLIVTCPCALSLAAPATLVAAARGLARRGVMLQRLDALEPLAQAQQVFLDKTGTLTADRLQVQSVHLSAAARAAGMDLAAVQEAAAALAAWSAHPVSRALAAHGVEESSGNRRGTPLADQPAEWSNVREWAGLGLSARDAQGREWRLGSVAWVSAAVPAPKAEDAGANTQAQSVPASAPAADSAAHGAAAGADARVAFGPAGSSWALFDLQEQLRPGTSEAVQALQASGAQVILLTGDAPARAQTLAQRLGLQRVQASARPEDKLAAVAAAQAQGHCVLMVGDGINDAPVLARADVSLAMGQGALVSRGQADAVIASNDLRDLVRARATAKKALAIVRQNMLWSVTYNAVCIPLALVGWLLPWAAGLGMACSSLVVVANALRATH